MSPLALGALMVAAQGERGWSLVFWVLGTLIAAGLLAWWMIAMLMAASRPRGIDIIDLSPPPPRSHPPADHPARGQARPVRTTDWPIDG